MVVGVIFKSSNKSPLPDMILVHFPKYMGPSFIDGESGIVPICPISAAWRHRNCTYSRQQFPLLLAYGLTIHKGQGMTLDKLILDIGKLKKKTFTGLIFCNQVIKSSAMASPILESHESGTWQVWHLDHFQIWRGMIL